MTCRDVMRADIYLCMSTKQTEKRDRQDKTNTRSRLVGIEVARFQRGEKLVFIEIHRFFFNFDFFPNKKCFLMKYIREIFFTTDTRENSW